MVKNPPEDYPRITAALAYDDPEAAIGFLEKAFGFRARLVIPGPDGKPVHVEMEVFDSLIMFGPGGCRPGFVSPGELDGKWNQSLYVYVENVDAHCAAAKEAGAEITSEPHDMFYGDRIYECKDPEGHAWTFAQHVKDVDKEELLAATQAGQPPEEAGGQEA